MITRLILPLLTITSALAVNLTWDQNPASDGPVTYRLYTTTNQTWTVAISSIQGTNASYNQVPVVASYRLTALNSAGLESDPSNVVTYTNRPGAPGGLRVVFMDWSSATNKIGLLTPTAILKTDPGAGLSSTISGPWGTLSRSGASDSNGVFKIVGKPATRPFTSTATVTKISANVNITSSQLFQ